MERKVIQLAGKTLVVSIPTKWAKEQGIKKGDGIDVKENKDCLIIETKNPSERKEINLANYSAFKHNVIGALYKAGFDEIKVYFDKSNEATEIRNELIKHFIGFETVEIGKNYFIMKDLTKFDDNPDLILKHVFKLLITNIEDSIKGITEKNEALLKSTIEADMSINRYANYSRRLISKSGIGPKSLFKYYIVEGIEKSGDALKDANALIIGTKRKITKEDLMVYSLYLELVSNFYEQYFTFNSNKLNKFKTCYEKIKELSSNESVIIQRMYFASNIIYNLNGALLGHNS